MQTIGKGVDERRSKKKKLMQKLQSSVLFSPSRRGSFLEVRVFVSPVGIK